MSRRKELEQLRDEQKRLGLSHKETNLEINKLKSDKEITDEIARREACGLCSDDLKSEDYSRHSGL